MGRKCANKCCSDHVSHYNYKFCLLCYVSANEIREDPTKYKDTSSESIKKRSAYDTVKRMVWDKQEESARLRTERKSESAQKLKEVKLASDAKKKKNAEEKLAKKKEKELLEIKKRQQEEAEDTVAYQKKEMQVQKTFLSALDQAIKILMWCEKSDSRLVRL